MLTKEQRERIRDRYDSGRPIPKVDVKALLDALDDADHRLDGEMYLQGQTLELQQMSS